MVRIRTVARKSSLGGLDIEKLIKPPMIYSVSYFDLEGLSTFLGGLSPPKLPRGDGTD